jgi:Ribbon-helix-helix protein, copG family
MSYTTIECMTPPRKLLSVRLDPALAEALEHHCAQTGFSRSYVVKQSVAQYLVTETGPTLGSLADAVLPPVSKRAAGVVRPPRQQRFREYVREKRRR